MLRAAPLLLLILAGTACASFTVTPGEPTWSRNDDNTASDERNDRDDGNDGEREREREWDRDRNRRGRAPGGGNGRTLSDDELTREMARARAAVPASPAEAPPRDEEARSVWDAALEASGRRIVISRETRALWLLDDDGVAFRAPVAVGKHEPFDYRGRRYDFKTPIGRRKVLGKATEPLWVPPDWHYFEIAAEQDLEPVQLANDSRVRLEDGTSIEVRAGVVGRINQFGNFWPFTPGNEIIFDGQIFIPPLGSPQRHIPEVLGTHKLELGDGYLIHGTNEERSIGDAVSHGCVRMFNADVEWLYDRVPNGTPVFVY